MLIGESSALLTYRETTFVKDAASEGKLAQGRKRRNLTACRLG